MKKRKSGAKKAAAKRVAAKPALPAAPGARTGATTTYMKTINSTKLS